MVMCEGSVWFTATMRGMIRQWITFWFEVNGDLRMVSLCLEMSIGDRG